MSVLAADQIPSTVPQYKKVTLTPTQVKSMRATPVELVAAPGAGFRIEPMSSTITCFATGATPYTTGGGSQQIRIKVNTVNYLLYASDGVLTAAVDTFETILSTGSDGAQVPGDVDNQPLVIAYIGDAELTLGDGDVTVEIDYTVREISA